MRTIDEPLKPKRQLVHKPNSLRTIDATSEHMKAFDNAPHDKTQNRDEEGGPKEEERERGECVRHDRGRLEREDKSGYQVTNHRGQSFDR